MKKFLSHVRKENRLYTSILLMMLIATVAIMVGTPSVKAQPTGTLALVDAVDGDQSVTWQTGSEPNNGEWFEVKLLITNVTDIYSASFSLHWDPTILNYSGVTWGDFLNGGIPFTGPVDYTNGYINEWSIGKFPPSAGINYTDPNWGWVATLNFSFVGTTPPIGYPINTLIDVLNDPGPPSRTSKWWQYPAGENQYESIIDCAFSYMTVETLIHDVAGFDVVTVSNTAVSTPILNITDKTLVFNITGAAGITGFCNVTIPKGLMHTILSVVIDSTIPDSVAVTENATHTFVDFSHALASTLQVTITADWVIPEFPTSVFLALLTFAAFAATILGKKVWSTRRRDHVIAK